MAPTVSKPGNSAVTAVYGGSLRVDVQDLMYISSGSTAQPASSIAAGANEAADQATLAAAFLGLAQERKLATDVAGYVEVDTEPAEILYPCVSGTYNIGDYVGGTRDGGAALVRGKVTAAAAQAGRIGVVTRYAPAGSTQVWVRFFSNKVPGYNRLS